MTDFMHYSPPCSTENPIQHKRRYHVFLSFRGPDVRKTLVDHLFLSLSTAGLHVFLDSERLQKGENIGVNLEEAIQGSTIYLPIFSPDYCTSAWCLKELSLMWASKSASRDTTIIPLFYKVEPSDVRYPDKKGPYAEALKRHNEKGRHTPEEMGAWKEALHQISLLSGWSLEYTSSGYEGRLVKQVVMDLVKALNIGCLHVAKYPVGLKTRKEEMIELLKIDEHGPKIVGIWGMGGIGKTTLSKAIYNEIRHLFEASCFVSNIRATARESSNGLKELQTQLLKGLVKIPYVQIDNVDEGKNKMKTHLASIRALVVLDDVDENEQFDALVGDWYGQGSRIIITTRDKKVLECPEVDRIHLMRGLDRHQGVELFSWHAFMRGCPEKGYEDMAERIVDACDGLPLSLEIVGAHLYNKSDLRYWSEAIENIPNVGDEKVYKTLKVSYDALTIQEKQIFLDIACFFVNKIYTLEFFVRFWKALGCSAVYTSLMNLEGKSLIVKKMNVPAANNYDESFCHFWMHDHVRDLGIRIVDEESWNNPSDRSRLWRDKDIAHVIATEEKMPNVRGLMSWGDVFMGEFKRVTLMQNLEYLYCPNLHLKSPINMLPPNLKHLYLLRCELVEGNSFSWDIFDQRSFTFRQSIGRLKFLHYLNLSDTMLLYLPNEIGELLCLEELHLFNCSLQELPQSFGNLVKLKILDVKINCLESLPANFNQLTSLEYLNASSNSCLKELPALPKALIKLEVERCLRIVKFPNLESLHSLRSINLFMCYWIKELPALPEGLQNLTFSGCSKVLPNMSALKMLKKIFLLHCDDLIKLPQLDLLHSLRELDIRCCEILVELPSLPEGLVILKVEYFNNLQKLSSMSHMKRLEIFHLSHCKRLTRLPQLNCLNSLRELVIKECEKLTELSSLPENLGIFKVTDCVNLQKIGDS